MVIGISFVEMAGIVKIAFAFSEAAFHCASNFGMSDFKLGYGKKSLRFAYRKWARNITCAYETFACNLLQCVHCRCACLDSYINPQNNTCEIPMLYSHGKEVYNLHSRHDHQ